MNKSQLKEKAKAILNGYSLGHIFDSSSSEYKFLCRIFQGHPEFAIKVGSGIKSIYTGVGEVYKTRCFFIDRTDGTYTDISYIRSIDGACSKISDIKCACRSAIQPVIDDFRSTVIFGVDTCSFTGELLVQQNTHIDHYDLTFNDLVDLWLKPLNIDSLHSLLNDSTKDNETKIYFLAEEIVNGFIAFHNEHTHLRAVSKTANLSTLKKKGR